jgi:hypothetical protein
MYESKYVVYKQPRQNACEVYWKGKPGTSVSKMTTCNILKARHFDTANDALDAVNAMVNLELIPAAALDMHIGKRMIDAEEREI